MIVPFGRPNDLRYENGLESWQHRLRLGTLESPRPGSLIREA
jgi:hypothetical protein